MVWVKAFCLNYKSLKQKKKIKTKFKILEIKFKLTKWFNEVRDVYLADYFWECECACQLF